MHHLPHRIHTLTTALTAALILATALTTTATAQRLSITNRAFRINWTNLEFFGVGGLVNPTISCRLTLEGSFHSNTIQKTNESLIGYVTRAVISPAEGCTGGAATVQSLTLPWHVRYRSFTGTLPNIIAVRLLLRTTGFALSPNGLGIICLYLEGSEPNNVAAGIVNREAGGNVTTLTADSAIRLRLFGGGALCPPLGGFQGTGQIFLLGSNTTRIRLTLI